MEKGKQGVLYISLSPKKEREISPKVRGREEKNGGMQTTRKNHAEC